MRSKRLFAFLLAFCMVFTTLAAPASAVVAPEMSVSLAEKSESENAATKHQTSPNANGLLVTEENAPQGLLDMREQPLLTVNVEEAEGKDNWTVTPAEGKPSVSLLPTETPEALAELQLAAEQYAADEVVHAFIVMEGKPLAEAYTSRTLVSAEVEKQMIQKQDALISSIEKMVLGGEKLEVRYQFTYLTNAITVQTAFGNLEKIAKMDGVKTVFLTPIFEPVTTASPNTVAAGAMTGVHTVWEDLGYTGTGMKIAIIDTGLDLDHPSFAADPETNEMSLTQADIEAVLTDLNAYARRNIITAKTLYRSAKVPFAFNYVDSSLTADHAHDGQGDHGTHVAGIAAANAVEGTNVVGMAPDAQLIIMKVFGANGGAYMDDVAAALEDAMTLGCDVVNASLGSPRGFSSSNSEIDLIYERLRSQDIVATFSAGNEGTSSYDNMWGTDLNRTQNPDNATVGSPSTWPGVMSIASAENSEVMTDNFVLADGTVIFFQDSMAAMYNEAGYEGYEWAVSFKSLAEVECEYVIVPGVGTEEDVASVDVEGKIAVIKRGTLNFSEKMYNAEMAGAIGVVLWNNNDTDDIFSFGMTIHDEELGYYPAIPISLVTMSDGQVMADAETKNLTVSSEQAARPCEGGQMSSFSSWGVSPDLRLLPDITGIGGNVYSCYDGGKYGLMSGTSMSAPQIAGVTALVMQHLYTIYPDAPDGTIRELAEAILMSTADPIISSGSGVEASPRQQGAGLVNAYEATTATTYLTVGGDRPKAELGDNANGRFTFTFEIHNIGEEDKTYTMDSSLLTEYAAYAGGELYFMYGENIPLSGKVTFDKQTVTVPAGGRANVTVSIALSEADKAYFARAWKNGGYVEGYVYLYNEEGVSELNLPFLGFYGDWTDAPIFDTAYWYDNSFWSVAPKGGLPEGDEYYHVLWTDLAGTDYVLGMNPYSGAVLDGNGNIFYDPANNVVSPNGDGVLDGISDIYFSLLRNAKLMTLTYTVDGETVYQEVIENNPKTMYISSYGQVIPWLYAWYGTGMYDFTGLDGKVLPNGTEVLLTVDAYIDYGFGGEHSIQIPITVDTGMPELHYVIEQNDPSTGENLIGFLVSDNISLASVVLMNASGTRIYNQVYDFQMIDMGDGTHLAVFDVTGLGTEFTVAVCDYACNEAYYDLVYTADPEGNRPEVDTSVLYGYRVDDDHLQSDHMFGWISTNKPAEGENAHVTVLTDDYLEYAAFTAADYAGGYVFAVDAVGNFTVLEPGIWNRKVICNLGMSVMDMAFDDVTDTMYVLGKNDWDDSVLYTIDLLTGELTEVLEFGYYNYGPWAITFDAEGQMIAIKVGSSNLFYVDLATGDMTAITDAEGNNFVMTDANGTKIAPTAYSQSIDYSAADNTIYFAHYKFSWWGSSSGMAAIDLTNFTTTYSTYSAQAYNAANELVTYYPQTEIVGLMVLEDTDYVLPEATELNAIALDQTEMILSVGETAKVKASPNPWNYELGQVDWSSSDESVASVSDGQILAVGEGTAVITASVGELTAECVVNVVNVDGNVYAYNYYSGDNNYGYLIDIDLATMDYSLVGAPGADFLAGEYNGHDGYFYGYSEGGQFWRVDLTNGETTAIGAAIGTAPNDMAYDYANGIMYAITFDQNMGLSTLHAVNLRTGELVKVADMYYVMLMTLACDMEGNLYAITSDGYLLQLMVFDGMMDGMPILENIGSLNYMQSMCYDYINDVIIWANPETSQMFWIDAKASTPYIMPIGNPVGSQFQFVGMFTVPEEIPELADVAVESVTAEDIMILTGTSKLPAVTILPLNATCQDIVWTSSDESVVTVNADGTLQGVAKGSATITGTLNDTVGGATYDVSFNATVIDPADDLYGHVLTDMMTSGGGWWSRIYPAVPSSPDTLGMTNYIMYAGEYYNGKLYAFGYDPAIWSGPSWSLFIMDPVTQVVEEQILQTENFPFIYDMTYDYATSTMYAVAGFGETETDLYVVNMETGELTLLMEHPELFMSIAAGPDGKLYAMESSQEVLLGYDDFGWEIYGFGNAQLYTIDPIAKTIEHVGDTGIQSNMIASMTYDYDTDMLYWTPIFRESFWGPIASCLAIVDPETAQGYKLGVIGQAGAQMSGLYTICEEFPAEPDPTLMSLIVTPIKADLVVGQTTQLKAITIPMDIEANITWSSTDADVATVDENGVVTAVSQGTANIVATAELNGITMTAECRVAILAEDACFLTYNTTDGGWAEISRADGQIVTDLTEGEEVAVASFTDINGTVYGFDVENNLFKLNIETYEREVIGQVDFEAVLDAYLTYFDYDVAGFADMAPNATFEVRDMAYDAEGDRILILGNIYDSVYGELSTGNAIYEVNLENAELTALHYFTSHVYVHGITVDTEGNLYFYNTFDDHYASMDLETYEITNIISLQSQSYYGSADHDHALYYDSITGKLYHLFTGNGNYYTMFSVDPSTGVIEQVTRYVGEVVYDRLVWGYLGDRFAGMTFINEDSNAGMPDVPVVPDYTVEWDCVNTSLGGNIGLNFYAKMSVDLVNEPSTFVRFTYDGKNVDVPMNEAVISGENRYRFTCRLNAKQMTELVTAQVMTEAGPVGEPVTISIAAYCNYILANSTNEADIAMMKAMLNYGSAAQVLFDYKTDALANAALDEADKVLADVDASGWKHTVSGSDDGIQLTNALLVLNSETSIRVYFKLTGEKSIEDYIFTVDGVAVTPVEQNGQYYIAFENIAAHKLGDMHEFCIGGYTLTYAGLSYVNQVLSGGTTDPATIDIAKALYAYHEAALGMMPR